LKKKVLFLAGNIIKLDANPIKTYDMLFRVCPYLDNSILIAFVEPSLFCNNSIGIKKTFEKFNSIGIDFKILPRLPLLMSLYIIIIIFLKRIEVIHAVGHSATFLGVVAKLFTGRKLISDFGGIVPDERVNAGIWEKNSLKYKISKFLEKTAVEYCDHVLVVSNTFKAYFLERYKINSIEVIPSCVNENRFIFDLEKRELMRNKFNLKDKLVVVFSGSFAPWDLSFEIISFFENLKKKINNIHFLILTPNKDRIWGMIMERGLKQDDFTIISLSFDEVPNYLLIGDVALLFRHNSIVHRVGSPMKFAEYLACGLPIIGNDGLGELCQIVINNRVGAIIDFDDKTKTEKIIDDLLNILFHERESLRQRCINIAIEQFSYKRFLNNYLNLYEY
jgi:glycosyltransferase involved in cell wall biosynthesis